MALKSIDTFRPSAVIDKMKSFGLDQITIQSVIRSSKNEYD